MDEVSFLRNFGSALRAARIGRELSQESLAEVLDVDRTYVSLLESGKRNPSLLLIGRIATALEIEPKNLLPNRGEK